MQASCKFSIGEKSLRILMSCYELWFCEIEFLEVTSSRKNGKSFIPKTACAIRIARNLKIGNVKRQEWKVILHVSKKNQSITELGSRSQFLKKNMREKKFQQSMTWNSHCSKVTHKRLTSERLRETIHRQNY